MPEAVLNIVGWPKPFAEVARVVGEVAEVGDFAQSQAGIWRKTVQSLPDGASAMLMTHGSVIELGAVACMPSADHATWGEAMGYCEGLRMSFDSDFIACDVLRMPQKYSLVSH